VADGLVAALGDVATIILSNVDKHIHGHESPVRLCNYLDVYRNRRISSHMEFSAGSVTPAEAARFGLRKGDVLVTKDSETPTDIGVPALATDDIPGLICGYHLAILRPTNGLDSGYLLHYLQSVEAKRHFLRTANGLTRFSLGLRALASLPVRLPATSEQAEIAKVLDAADGALGQIRKALRHARDLDRSLLHDLLDGGKRASGTARGGSAWPIRRVDEVADVGSGITLGKGVSGVSSVELPYLRVANVQDGHLDLTTVKTVRVPITEAHRFQLQVGDVLMTEGGDIDKLGRGTIWQGQIPNCLHQNHIFRVRAHPGVLAPQFYALIVESDIAKRYFTRVAKQTTNLASTNKTQVRAFRFPVPPTLAEQSHIADVMDASRATLRALAAQEQAVVQLKATLADELISGRARVAVAVPASVR